MADHKYFSETDTQTSRSKFKDYFYIVGNSDLNMFGFCKLCEAHLNQEVRIKMKNRNTSGLKKHLAAKHRTEYNTLYPTDLVNVAVSEGEMDVQYIVDFIKQEEHEDDQEETEECEFQGTRGDSYSLPLPREDLSTSSYHPHDRRRWTKHGREEVCEAEDRGSGRSMGQRKWTQHGTETSKKLNMESEECQNSLQVRLTTTRTPPVVADSYDDFGRYIASLLRSVGPPHALMLQQEITTLITNRICNGT